MRFLMLATVTVALAACATDGEPREDLDPATDPRVGEPQSQICFRRGINAFAEYGDEDGLLLRQGVNDWYLVTFAGVCADLGFARAVSLGSDPANSGCLRQGDRIFVSSAERTSPVRPSCLVRDIYTFDRNAKSPTSDEEASEADTP